MPRYDFACQGCYLGAGANRVPALPLDAVKAQMHSLRTRLEPCDNLQLTDGDRLPPDAGLFMVRA